MRFDDPRTEWRIADVERKVDQVQSTLYRMDSCVSDVARMEYTIREISSENASLRYELQSLQEDFRKLNEEFLMLRAAIID